MQNKEKADLLSYIDEPTVYDIFHQNLRWQSFGTGTSEHLVKEIFGTISAYQQAAENVSKAKRS